MKPQIQSIRYYDKTFIGQIKSFLIDFLCARIICNRILFLYNDGEAKLVDVDDYFSVIFFFLVFKDRFKVEP